ncbi:hypothetical protein P167DRAFT_556109 [Morchella conica CCBAS932]|uniref:Pre-mRNA-splicing factor SLU7 n=1 Tax=Morchella conica CCBAS932 TaxID=1392247 RepID=A0A3N4L3Z6_9PEZI|nr:hypothetical protein P167DRAFT_556109 [Morchella conica CCBAS932]
MYYSLLWQLLYEQQAGSIVDNALPSGSLEHQRLQKPAADTLSTQKWYDRGAKTTRATKYRAGACTNCGAMTHTTKDCLSRPRKLGARWTGQDIQPDEAIQTLELGWDGKRDRWNGYDAREHQRVVDDHLRMEALRKQSEASTATAAAATAAAAAAAAAGDGDDDDNDDKYAEESETPGQGYDAASRISTRNLRIREDTAKYLLNLDLDSAKYDPKTRTMVDRGATSDQAAALVAEDNFMRSSGDAAEFERLQRAAWETRERGEGKGGRMHLQANPTEAERLERTAKEAAQARRDAERKRLLERYGGGEYLAARPAPVLEEEERYVEYTPEGQVKGREKVVARSKYREDMLVGNHGAVWGSWWRAGRWGYCTGEEGIRAAEVAEGMRLGLVEPVAPRRVVQELEVRGEVEEEMEEDREDRGKGRGKGKGKKEEEGESATEKGKRKLAQMRDGVTEEDMEMFMKQRRLAEDPMAGFVDVV